jgi:membrane-associated phospholipid phosphatase
MKSGVLKCKRAALLFSGLTFSGFALLLIFIGNQPLFLWINQHLTPTFGQSARLFSFLGESFGMVVLLLISTRQAFRKTLTLLLAWLLGACFSWLFKLWLMAGAARPLEYFLKNPKIQLNVVEGVTIHHFNSFPSGHTLTAFSVAILTLFLFPSSKKWVQVIVILMAWCCGLSRIILVQHWPVDVLGGMAFGILSALLSEGIIQSFSAKSWMDVSLAERIGGWFGGR